MQCVVFSNQAKPIGFTIKNSARKISSLLHHYSRQPALVQRFLEFDRTGEQSYLRQAPGHFTASCWLVDASGEHVLLTHHRKLRRWLQLGGHADGDTDLMRVALTEAQEESGLLDLSIAPEIFDLDVHEIPARAEDAAHLHWDVRFVVRANGGSNFVTGPESIALAWVPIRDIVSDQSQRYDDSLRRMALRWIAQANECASIP